MQILNVTGLKKVYTTRFGGSQVTALRQVDFSVEEGEYVAIMGESGSGKTTLLNILAALDKPTAGRVELDGRDMAAVRESDAAAFRRDNLGFVFQEFNLLDTFTLRDNIYLPLVLAGRPYRELKARLDPIARQLGILSDPSQAITGAALDALSDEELTQNVDRYSVYARVQPEHKVRIVSAWRRRGAVTAMTGDGVNDAPALKAADIGCAMGITGTDVAKGAADMTLTDDNFATIVDAVREGRGIYANIRKVVGFLLGTNIGEVITVFAAMLLWRKTPLLSMQLLLINLATDSLPAIALGMEAVEADVMDKKPKPKSEGLFAHGLGVRIVLQGFLFALLTLIGFVAGEKATGTLAGGQTLAFMVLALSQVVQAYNMRSDRSLFAIGPFSNHKLNWAALASTALVALVLFTPVGIAFGLVTLPWPYYLLGLGLILAPLLVMEIAKLCGLIRHHGRK